MLAPVILYDLATPSVTNRLSWVNFLELFLTWFDLARQSEWDHNEAIYGHLCGVELLSLWYDLSCESSDCPSVIMTNHTGYNYWLLEENKVICRHLCGSLHFTSDLSSSRISSPQQVREGIFLHNHQQHHNQENYHENNNQESNY